MLRSSTYLTKVETRYMSDIDDCDLWYKTTSARWNKKHSDSIVYVYIYIRISCIGKEQSSEKMSNIGMNFEFKFPEYELQPRSSMCSEFTF